MRPTRFLMLLSILLGTGCSDGAGPSGDLTENRTLFVDGEPHTLILHVPESATPSALIVAFHGAGGDGFQMRDNTDLDRVAADPNAAVAYPSADLFNWAEDCDCTSADIMHGVGDTAFVSALIDSVTEELGIASSEVYAVGFSQGGMFAQRLACQMSDRFRAVAVIAATMGRPLSERCAPTTPVSVLMVLSQLDPFFGWSGQQDGAFSTLGAEAAVDLWGALNLCETAKVQTTTDGGPLRATREDCIGGARVELVGVRNGSHAWVISPAVSAGTELRRFLWS